MLKRCQTYMNMSHKTVDIIVETTSGLNDKTSENQVGFQEYFSLTEVILKTKTIRRKT